MLYRVEELIMNESVTALLALLKVISIVFFIAHWIACLFFAVGSGEIDAGRDGWIVNFDMQDKETEV